MRPNEEGFPNSANPTAVEPNSTTGGYNARPGYASVAVLLICPSEEDHEFFSSMFQLPCWKAYHVRTYHEALRWLTQDRMTLIICDSHLPDGNWKDILSQTQILPDPPRIIVTSGLPDDVLWGEVLNLGGYDLLAKPFVREEVVRTAELASMNWHSEAEDGADVRTPRKAPRLEGTPRREKPRTAAAG